MSGGKSPKKKGDAFERSVIKLLGGERTFWQPERGDKRGDIYTVPYLGQGECKIRKAGFKQIYDWLANNDFLAIRADRKPALVIIRAEDLKLLLDEMDELKRKINREVG